MVGRGMQDVEVTARWHTIWLGCTVVFFATTVLFSGLFGGYYSAWKNQSPCNDGQFWVFGNGIEFDDACHVVRDDGLYAIEGAACPTECDNWWHKQHPTFATSGGRRLQTTNYAKLVRQSGDVILGDCICTKNKQSELPVSNNREVQFSMPAKTQCNNGTLSSDDVRYLYCGLAKDQQTQDTYQIILRCNQWIHNTKYDYYFCTS
jgi:hypothetical protein